MYNIARSQRMNERKKKHKYTSSLRCGCARARAHTQTHSFIYSLCYIDFVFIIHSFLCLFSTVLRIKDREYFSLSFVSVFLFHSPSFFHSLFISAKNAIASNLCKYAFEQWNYKKATKLWKLVVTYCSRFAALKKATMNQKRAQKKRTALVW